MKRLSRPVNASAGLEYQPRGRRSAFTFPSPAPAAALERRQQFSQQRGEFYHFIAMGDAQFRQNFFGVGCEIYQDFAPVRRVLPALNQAVCYEAIDEFDSRVVPNAEALGQDPDRHVACRRSLDCEQRLVLLRAEPHLRGGMLAEFEEPAQMIAKFG